MAAHRMRTAALVAASLAATLLPLGAVAHAAPPEPRQPSQLARAAAPARPQHVGSWRVEPNGPGSWTVSWTSPTRLPLTSDRPQLTGGALTFSAAAIGADQRTVSAQVTSPTRPVTAQLHVLLSGDRLDVPGSDPARTLAAVPAARAGGSTTDRATAAADVPVLADDPGTPGPYATVSSDYTLDPVKLPGMPVPIEMVGHVVEPAPDAATGPRPLVLFLHGRHEVCYVPGRKNGGNGDWPCDGRSREIPSQLGYVYIQQLLASQGYTTVSIRVNGINAQDYRLPDGGAGARAAIVEQHLDYWTGIAAQHQVDLHDVVLVGHSRGGEGVDRASLEIPLSAPYRIAGQVLIAPTDFASQTAAYVPTVTILPYCDGDVSDLQGQQFTDVSQGLAADDTSLKSSVLVMGADHNFFNTQWTPGVAVAPANDDWYGPAKAPCGTKTPQRLSAAQQRSVGATYVAGAVGLFAKGDQQYLPLFDGSRVTVPSIGGAEVLSSAIGGGRDLRVPGVGAGLSLPSGARTSICQGRTTSEDRVALCGRRVRSQITPNWVADGSQQPVRRFFEMSWTRAGQSGGLVWRRPLDLSSGDLDLRTIVDPRIGDVGLRVRITDGSGASTVLTPVGGESLPVLLTAPYVTKMWAQTLQVDPSTATGVDLTDITGVDLIGTSARGRVWVADVAAAPTTLPAVPAERLPVITLGRLQQSEGGRGAHVARVPFTVSGTISRPVRFSVVTAGEARGSRDRFSIDLAPGQTSGSVPIAYEGNTLDDPRVLRTSVAAYSGPGISTGSWLGSLNLLDDDPTPTTTVRPRHKTVREGESATWRIRLSTATDYDDYVSGQVVAGPQPELSGGDVSASWLHRYAGSSTGGVDPASTPLSELGVDLFDRIRAGSRSVLISVPIRRDGLAEGRESITMRFRVGHQTFLSTVHVAPSR